MTYTSFRAAASRCRPFAIWLTCALLACLAIAPSGVALAAGPSLTLKPVSGAPGARIEASGAGFSRFASVTLTWQGTSEGRKTVTARADGSFRTSVRIPRGASAGDLMLRAVSGSTEAIATARVVGSATPLPTATRTPVATATRTPSAQPTATPSRTATVAVTATATPTRTATAIPTRTETAVPTRTATAVPTQTSGGPPSGTSQERVHVLVNQARAQQGLAPLAWHPALARAAQTYAEAMAAASCFSHTCPPVTDMSRRAELAGYTPWRSLGENIAAGYQTPEQVVQAWLNSPPHRANIMSATFRETGVGIGRGGSYGIYWAQEFGSR